MAGSLFSPVLALSPARFLLIIAALLAVVPTVASAAQNIVGRASVIDGNTLEIRGTRIRLHGIDAPEARQSCLVNGAPSPCGQQASRALSERIGNQIVICEPRDRDQGQSVAAVCRAGGEDLNAWMVSAGMALAYRRYSTKYVRQEKRAAKKKSGIWRGAFIKPWDWRRGKRLTIHRSPDDNACTIKGNISQDSKRVYHIPGGQYYGPLLIDPAKGERWFCSEADAKKAGWRKSRR